jgi:hypothetical protein
MATVSAQYSIILRVEIDHRPGMLGRVATAVGDAGGVIGSVDLISADAEHTLRDITVDAAGENHARRIGAAVGPDRRRAPDRHHGPHVPRPRRRQDRAAQQAPAQHPRRPVNGLHARRRPGLQRDCGGPREGL